MTCICASQNIMALDTDFSGFLTLGVGRLDSKDVTFLDFDDHMSFANDTRIGGQFDIHLNEQLSLVTQAVVAAYTYTPDEDYEFNLTNAYMRYKPSLSHIWRAGILSIPSYYFSDYASVGAAYPWVRLPTTTYDISLLSLSRAYAIDYFHQRLVGDWFLGVQAIVLQPLDKTTNDGDFRFDPGMGLNIKAQKGDFSLRFSYYNADLTYIETSGALDQLVSGLQSLSVIPGLESYSTLADDLIVENAPSSYTAFGVVWEPSAWSFYTELYQVESDHLITGKVTGGYISILRQFERLAPYILYGRSRKLGGDNYVESLIAAANPTIPLPAFQLASIATIDAAVGMLAQRFSNEHDTVSLGIRYDISDSVVLKAEVERMKSIDENNIGSFSSRTSDYSGDSVYLYSLSLDMIF